MRTTGKSDAIQLLEKITGGPLTLGRAVEAIRKWQGLSQDACALELGVSKSHLCDVKKGRKRVSARRAARWARILGDPDLVLVRLALQSEVDAAGLKCRIRIDAA